MPQSPEQVTVNDAIDAMYAMGVPVVMPNAPTEAQMPALIGALMYAADSLMVHKNLLTDDDARAIVDGWLNAAGAETMPTQALAIASSRAGATAALFRAFTAEGALYRSMTASASAAHRFAAAAGAVALARRDGGVSDEKQVRALMRDARNDLRDAVRAYESMRKELKAMGHDI